MILTEGRKFIRDGEKIGWFESARIYNADGKELGYFEDDKVCDHYGRPLGYLRGDYFRLERGEKIELEKLREKIQGREIPDLARAAAWVLLGD